MLSFCIWCTLFILLECTLIETLVPYSLFLINVVAVEEVDVRVGVALVDMVKIEEVEAVAVV